MSQSASAWTELPETTQVDSFPEETTKVISLRVVKGKPKHDPRADEPRWLEYDEEDERRTSLMNDILGAQAEQVREQDRRIDEQIKRNRAALSTRMKRLSNKTDTRFKEHGESIRSLKRQADEQRTFLVRGLRNLATVEKRQTSAGLKIAALETTVAGLKNQLHDVRARQYTAGLSPTTNMAATKQPASRKMFSDFHLFVIAAVFLLSGVVAFIAQHANF
jgi:hypothetical protein